MTIDVSISVGSSTRSSVWRLANDAMASKCKGKVNAGAARSRIV